MPNALGQQRKLDDRVLLVESLRGEPVHPEKTQRGERLMTKDKVAAPVHLARQLPSVKLNGQCQEDITLPVWINVATPEM